MLYSMFGQANFLLFFSFLLIQSLYRCCLLGRPPIENTIPLPMVLCCQDRGRPTAWLSCTSTPSVQKPQSLTFKKNKLQQKQEPLTSDKNNCVMCYLYFKWFNYVWKPSRGIKLITINPLYTVFRLVLCRFYLGCTVQGCHVALSLVLIFLIIFNPCYYVSII